MSMAVRAAWMLRGAAPRDGVWGQGV